MLLIYILALASVALSQELPLYTGNAANVFGHKLETDNTMTSWKVETSSTTFTPKKGSYFYTDAKCKDISMYNEVEITMTAPADSDFIVELQSPNKECTKREYNSRVNTKDYVTFDGTKKVFTIPLSKFDKAQLDRLWSFSMHGFNKDSTHTLYSVKFKNKASDKSLCSMYNEPNVYDDFTNLSNWEDNSQAGGNKMNYIVNDGMVKFVVPTNKVIRPKLRIKGNGFYGSGRHQWKVHIPNIRPGEMASVGAFLWASDTHEFDFETGYAPLSVRKNLNVKNNEVVTYLVSHYRLNGKPAVDESHAVIATNKWYIFTLDLNIDKVTGHFITRWWIDGKLLKTAKQNWGPKDLPRGLMPSISVENFPWMSGGHPKLESNDQTTVYFDSYRFTKMDPCAESFPEPSS